VGGLTGGYDYNRRSSARKSTYVPRRKNTEALLDAIEEADIEAKYTKEIGKFTY
jgi:hypothetical protein